MGTGYTRNDTPNNIADGNVINASDLDGEFDAIQSAFNASTGHSHDGTTGEGPQIATAGLAGNAVTTAKILDANVTLAKIAANSVDSVQYVDGSIDTAHIANDAVTGDKLANNIQIAGTLGVTGETTLTTHLNMGDNDIIKLGASADLQIYHDGSNSYIADEGTGGIIMSGGTLTFQNQARDETHAVMTVNGSVDLYHNNIKKLETTSTGVTVTGELLATTVDATTLQIGGTSITATATELNYNDITTLGAVTASKTVTADSSGFINFADNQRLRFGAGADLQIYHDGLHSYISDQGTGSLKIFATNLEINNAGNTANYIEAFDGGAVRLYYSNALKLATTSTGIDVTGTVVSDGMSTNTAGNRNFIAGVNAGNSIASGGNYNTAVGDEAGTSISTGDSNVMVGYQAGTSVNTGVNTVAIGYQAGDAIVGGNNNVAIGKNSLGAEVSGSLSVAIGSNALAVQNTGADAYNIAIGHSAGVSVTSGIRNTLIGGLAGDALNDADSNVALGYLALSASTQDSRNVAIGTNAFQVLNYGSTANFEAVAVGYDAGRSVTTGLRNQLFGAFAGKNIDTGQKNTCVGYDAGATLTSGGQNTCLGFEATVASASANNSITLGNADVTALRCQQTSISSLSDARDKMDIIDLPYGLDFINKTRPVQFKWNLRDAKEESTLNGTIRNGFIAQELQELGNNDQHQLVYDENPEKLEARYGNLMPMLVKAVQELSEQVTALQSELKTIKGE